MTIVQFYDAFHNNYSILSALLTKQSQADAWVAGQKPDRQNPDRQNQPHQNPVRKCNDPAISKRRPSIQPS